MTKIGKKRREHLTRLATELNVLLFLDPPMPDRPLWGWAYPAAWAYPAGHARVDGWDGSQAAYFIGLHELGHHALGHITPAYRQDVLGHEIEAWDWALSVAQEKPTPRTRQRIVGPAWLGSYVRHGRDNDRYRMDDFASALGVEWRA